MKRWLAVLIALILGPGFLFFGVLGYVLDYGNGFWPFLLLFGG